MRAHRRPPGATSASWRIARGIATERQFCGTLHHQYGQGLALRDHHRRAARRAAPTHLLLGGYPVARFEPALAQLTGQKMGPEYVWLCRGLLLVCALTRVLRGARSLSQGSASWSSNPVPLLRS